MTRLSAVKGGFPDFDQYWSNSDHANFSGNLRDSKSGNLLEIQGGQIVFTHHSPAVERALNLEESISEFLKFYKVITKHLGSPAIRRIGIVGEFYSSTCTPENCSLYLSDKLVRFNRDKKGSKRFQLVFDDQEPIGSAQRIDPASSEFWNSIYNIYPSELDATTATEGGFRTTLDVQRYYNPAPSDVSKVIHAVVDKFRSKRKSLKEEFVSLGLIDV